MKGRLSLKEVMLKENMFGNMFGNMLGDMFGDMFGDRPTDKSQLRSADAWRSAGLKGDFRSTKSCPYLMKGPHFRPNHLPTREIAFLYV